jgi:hypothetical protein
MNFLMASILDFPAKLFAGRFPSSLIIPILFFVQYKLIFCSHHVDTPFKKVSSRICFRGYEIQTATPYDTDIGQ